ncbi:hypothetical protein IDSA_09655 [Pseudidiomarina salinarum]|uniref:HemY N-terminal domain-containing protein n=1 Tax=Pseudidiomarina salinarum TaxID=435908 RepID=A0A094ISV0_9GAMM|nr:heme biosynthesis HemY N-terminal domain-containing protein [Pseudidiomarina salinarum]KFZ30770.1 hypothetical protein IDSA_09655 [Pseudidiomarina salinarum]RUO69295.1 hypothetical protein CWI79_10345 [Pseudidiomarina salinarum]
MKTALILVLLLAAGLLLGPLWSGNTGYVLIAIGHLTIETSLVAAAIFLVIAVILLRFILGLIMRLVRSTRWGVRWFGKRRQAKAQQAFDDGVRQLLNGDYRAASAAFNRSWQLDHHAVTAMLAGYAAQHIGELGQARDWLARSEQADKLQLSETLMTLRAEPEQAARRTELLEKLTKEYPQHPQLLRLAIDAYVRLHRWQEVLRLLPAAERLQLFNTTEYQQLVERAHHQLMLEAGRSGSDQLHQYWRGLSREQRRFAPIRRAYLAALINFGHTEAAGKVAARGLKRGDLKLAHLIDGELLVPGTELQEWIQDTLKRKPDDAMALQALGQLSLLTKDYSLAQRALRKAADVAPSRRVYLDLAQAYSAQGDPVNAVKAYQQALRE